MNIMQINISSFINGKSINFDIGNYQHLTVIGGNNGSGKTLLLQFVYALLTQWDSVDTPLLRGFIDEHIPLEVSKEVQTLASLTFWDSNEVKKYTLNFRVIKDTNEITLLPLESKLPLEVYLIIHMSESHIFLNKDNEHFFYYEDIYNRSTPSSSLGERKNTSLQNWIANVPSPNAIILMDNPDVFLHSDLVYNLAKDLYYDYVLKGHFLIATHSYEFCEAITPAQVHIIK